MSRIRPAPRRAVAAVAILLALALSACATVPKEVVELSYVIGEDLTAVHASYRTLISAYFDALRDRTVTFLDTRWRPAYLRDFIEEGELVSMATAEDPQEVLMGVSVWAEVAIEEIESKRRELLDPIDAAEADLMKSVDEAFAQIIRGNATISAHLNSLRKVQEVQDEALEAVRLKDLRDRVNDGLVNASDMADRAIRELEEKGEVIDDLEERLETLRGGGDEGGGP
jgi:hypothetical protein